MSFKGDRLGERTRLSYETEHISDLGVRKCDGECHRGRTDHAKGLFPVVEIQQLEKFRNEAGK